MVRRPILAFDDVVNGTAAVYSSSFFDALLGQLERFGVQVVVQALTDVSSLTVQIETSADGRKWAPKNATADVSQGSVSQGSQVVLYGSDVAVVAAHGLARVCVQLSGAAPSARVKVYITPSSRVPDLPPRVAGCKVWARADLGVTAGSGNVVSAWADQSGNRNDLLQATAGRQPVWTPNALNGLPTLVFDGSNDVLTAAFALGAYTVVLVTSNQAVGTNGYFWSRSTGGVEANTLFDSTNSTMYITRASTTSGWDLSAGWGQWTAATKVLIVTFDGTHAGHKLRINSVEQTLTTTFSGNPGSATTNDTFAVGGRADAAVAASIAVAEVAVYDRVLNGPQLAAIEEYARRRYKLY